MSILFDNTYINLPDEFYSKTKPHCPPSPNLIIYNEALAKEIGLNNLSLEEKTNLFSGKLIPEGSAPIAMVYSGHQFGHFSPRLGDGRALLLGEVVNSYGKRFDIHLKGSGPTEYSRRGDGKVSIGPALREYLASEAMHKLNIPTTRALAVTTTGESIQREELLPGAVITRTSESFIRVGTFEYFARHGDIVNLKKLFDYTVQRNFPELIKSNNIILDFFNAVKKNQIFLTAKWMSVGFIHGVMNTDNSSISGLTIDYGPCAFMDHFQSDRVFSSIDRNGRYKFDNQPAITQWNLSRLAECLLALYTEEESKLALNQFKESINSFESHFTKQWLICMAMKLGITSPENSDLELIKMWLDYMENNQLDFTNSFRALSSSLEFPSNHFNPSEQFNSFYKKWKSRLPTGADSLESVKYGMDLVNPIYIPRNHLVEDMINKAIEGDYVAFNEFNKILSKPFTKQDVDTKYTTPPTEQQIVPATFCGT